MGRERTLQTLVVSAVLLVVFGLVKPNSPDPGDNATAAKAWFFVNKTHQVAEYDMVVVGDSRALRAVSPAIISESLPDRRIFNFAFHAGGLNKEIFTAAEALLAPGANQKAILLAPTALSFMPIKVANSQFHEYQSKPRDVVWLYANARPLANWFQPIAPGLVFRKFLGQSPSTLLFEEFHGDGWIATSQTPVDDLTDLGIHRQRVSGHHVDESQIAEFMVQTKKWQDEGINVFAFFPPASPPRIAMEDSVLGFDKAAFVATFTANGGVWLDVEAEGYDSYDGSHLEFSSAEKLSRKLGAILAQSW